MSVLASNLTQQDADIVNSLFHVKWFSPIGFNDSSMSHTHF